VTERLAASSYPADEALLAELRGVSAAVGATGSEPAAVLRLADRFAIAVVPEPAASTWTVTPLARQDGRWRKAGPGDGLSAFVTGAPAASERAIDVDQTNESVVVGERVIVKWFRHVGPGSSRAAVLVGHLEAVGYAGIPKPLGAVDWVSSAGETLTLAQGDMYLPGARDGWDWCVEALENDPGRAVGRDLGRLVAGLHSALATPSPLIAEPTRLAGSDEIAGWCDRALATLDDALSLTDGDDGGSLREMESAIRSALESIPSAGPLPIQPVHGDLHVGQVLEWPGGLAIIDFDGNPTLGDDANAIRQPIERDVAQMLSSLDHVGRVVAHRRGGEPDAAIEAWIATQRGDFLAEVGPANPALLAAFEAEQECRELVYAARFLPRWRYAPMATLRARFGDR
jgi:maltokinase